MLLTALLLRHMTFMLRKGNSNCRAPMDASCERDDIVLPREVQALSDLRMFVGGRKISPSNALHVFSFKLNHYCEVVTLSNVFASSKPLGSALKELAADTSHLSTAVKRAIPALALADAGALISSRKGLHERCHSARRWFLQ